MDGTREDTARLHVATLIHPEAENERIERILTFAYRIKWHLSLVTDTSFWQGILK